MTIKTEMDIFTGYTFGPFEIDMWSVEPGDPSVSPPVGIPFEPETGSWLMLQFWRVNDATALHTFTTLVTGELIVDGSTVSITLPWQLTRELVPQTNLTWRLSYVSSTDARSLLEVGTLIIKDGQVEWPQ